MLDKSLKEMKARAVSEGNRAQTKTGVQAATLYQEVSDSPAAMVTTRAAAAAAAARRALIITGRDAGQAYVQSSIRGRGRPSCWARPPKKMWPASW